MSHSPMSNSPMSNSPMTNSPMSNPDQRPASEAEPAQSAPPDVGDHWLGRTLRTLFGSKAGSIRADLRTALEKGAGEGSFSPKESAMLSNILSLRERRVADVMVPRADIIAVQKSIALGDLLKVFASQAHPRPDCADDGARRRRSSAGRRAAATPDWPRSQGDRPVDVAFDRQARARAPVCTAVDAGA